MRVSDYYHLAMCDKCCHIYDDDLEHCEKCKVYEKIIDKTIVEKLRKAVNNVSSN